MSSEERENQLGAATGRIGEKLPEREDFFSTGLFAHDLVHGFSEQPAELMVLSSNRQVPNRD